MKTGDILKDAVKNTSRSKLRTSLTVMAIFVGSCTLTLTNSIGAGVSSYIDNQLGALGNPDIISVSKPVERVEGDGPVEYEESKSAGDTAKAQQGAAQAGYNIAPLTRDDLTALENITNIEKVEPSIMVQPDYIQGTTETKYVLSTNPASAIIDPDIKTGADFSDTTEKNEVILPQSYVEPLGYTENDIIGEIVTIGITDYAFERHTVEATIVGVQNKSLFGESVSMNSPLTESLHELQKAGLPETEEQYIAAFATMTSGLEEEQVNELKAELEEAGFVGTTIEDQIGSVQAVINGLIAVLNAFAVITLIAASFGIMNTLLMSVKERTREIGLMKAMGMSSKKIYALFSFEAVFIGFLGSVIGAVTAIGVGTLASNILSQTLLADLEGLTISLFTVPDVATVILVVMFIAFLSGTIPAANAAKQNPIDALHYE